MVAAILHIELLSTCTMRARLVRCKYDKGQALLYM